MAEHRTQLITPNGQFHIPVNPPWWFKNVRSPPVDHQGSK
jgi:hypothetical protein